jgi:hypothetical protein
MVSCVLTASQEGMGCETASLRRVRARRAPSRRDADTTHRIAPERPDSLERRGLAAGVTRKTTIGYAMHTAQRPCRVRGGHLQGLFVLTATASRSPGMAGATACASSATPSG